MRYIWSMYDAYFGNGRAGIATRLAMKAALPYLRRWDVRTAARPDFFVANSENVRQRILRIYGRTSDLIYPPVNTSAFSVSGSDDGYFLIVSALVPYKYVDLAVEAFGRTRQKLIVVGDGPELPGLKKRAAANVEFAGHVTDEVLREYYARCRAVVFPGEEDFGIVPVEAMASGKPVIAFARGGALETVRESPELKTGILFQEQTVEALVAALRVFETSSFDPLVLRRFAERFDRNRFVDSIKAYVDQRWVEFERGLRQPHV
jgi:glycosyltransferase involved in cell wall biosynthesis